MDKFNTQQITELLERNALFRNIDIFDKMSFEKDIFEIVKISYIAPGQILMKKGEFADSIVLILTGTVDVQVKNNQGHEIKAASVEANSFVGEMAIVDQTTRMATVRATTECCIGTIHSNDFWNYFKKNPSLAKNVIIEMNKRNKEVSANFINRLLKENEDEKLAKEKLEKMVEDKTRQLREKDVQLMTMDRLSGITTLAAGIAHEINNPLSFVKGSVSFVKKGVSKMVGAAQFWDDKEIDKELLNDYKEYLSQINFEYMIKTLDEKFERIKKGIDRIIIIVKNLKSFSRVDKENVSSIDINQSISEALEVLNTEERENLKFFTELENLPFLKCCANEIHQCLFYIIQNAIDAVEDNGIIRICSSYNKNDKQIIIKIIDNGKGMEPGELRRAMNPFYTTKPVGSGTGLGLTITEKIIASHKGNIHLSSKKERGTTVTMELPIDANID